MTDVRICRRCEKDIPHNIRLEGNVATKEEHAVRFCVRCGTEESRVQTRAKVLEVRFTEALSFR